MKYGLIYKVIAQVLLSSCVLIKVSFSFSLQHQLKKNNVVRAITSTGRSSSTTGNTIYECMTTILDDTSFHSFQQSKENTINNNTNNCIYYWKENAISSTIINTILDDCIFLKTCNFGSIADITTYGSSSSINNNNNTTGTTKNSIRHNVHQTWIRNVGSTQSIQSYVGNINARTNLINFIEMIRSALDNNTDNEQYTNSRILPSNLIELSYLSYDSGAYYKRHIDVPITTTSTIGTRTSTGTSSETDNDQFRTSSTSRSSTSSQRCVSLLLYLGDDTNQREWDTSIDGGSLRIYNSTNSSRTTTSTTTSSNSNFIAKFDDNFFDIEPQPGTLVLFDSHNIPHEVLTTYRSRHCVVGWFGKYI